MKLYLVDGYGFVFRAYHSLPPLTRPDGTPIGAVYGFTSMLLKILDTHQADYIAVVLDAGQKNFRHDLYEAYKANRPPAPEDLIPQLKIIPQVVEAVNLPVLQKSGYEADDLIATYTARAVARGWQVEIVSSDKDLMQLVNEQVQLYDPLKNKTISIDDVKAKLGVAPQLVQDYLSLVGDSSDNIPGAKGIGAKTAVKLLQEFGSIGNIYENISAIKQPRRQQLLLDSKSNVYLSRQLLQLDQQVPLEITLEELAAQPLDYNKLSTFLTEQNFLSLLHRVNKSQDKTITTPQETTKPTKSIIIGKIADLELLAKQLLHKPQVSILTTADAVHLASGHEQWVIPFGETPSRQETMFSIPQSANNLTAAQIYNALSEVFTAPYVNKITFDAKQLLITLKQHGIELRSYDDVAVMAYALATGKYKCELADLIAVYLGETAQEENALAVQKLFTELSNLLFNQKMWTVYERLDKPMIACLAEMEMRGIKVDAMLLNELSSEFHDNLAKIASQIYALAGCQFNIASPKQIGEVLFDKMQLPAPKKSKTGAYGTGLEILEKLADQGYEIASLILSWRQFAKLISTYSESLPKNINPKTKRVHSTFALTATSTGRLASHNPNLQNIPIRTEAGSRIRQAFIAETGNVIISADYSQIELRLLAVLADIPVLKDAFAHDHDIHAITASQMFSIPLAEVSSELRRQAKMINFGIIYGISPIGLARRLDIDVERARQYIAAYFKQYPGIQEYMHNTIEIAKRNGYVETMLGRKCYIKGINDRNFNIRSFAERAAINAPLQGTAADIIKKAMVLLPHELQQYLILQIHDELLFEVPAAVAESLYEPIRQAMENTIPLGVPLKVDISHGRNWLEA